MHDKALRMPDVGGACSQVNLPVVENQDPGIRFGRFTCSTTSCVEIEVLCCLP